LITFVAFTPAVPFAFYLPLPPALPTVAVTVVLVSRFTFTAVVDSPGSLPCLYGYVTLRFLPAAQWLVVLPACRLITTLPFLPFTRYVRVLRFVLVDCGCFCNNILPACHHHNCAARSLPAVTWLDFTPLIATVFWLFRVRFVLPAVLLYLPFTWFCHPLLIIPDYRSVLDYCQLSYTAVYLPLHWLVLHLPDTAVGF